jgi:hypothetical protein
MVQYCNTVGETHGKQVPQRPYHDHTHRQALHQAKGFNPMEEVPLEKAVDLVVVMELSTTLLKMMDPVEACILYLWGKAFL